ncbi:winged helix-turn-helix domain-containing protein [Siphonobacter sp.]|uniref:winged helix-turn-helix domain-containing protein n=1 Tax=Siphonobacter sp. TaxID=1869184 RepID=UPI003B3B3644
MRHVILTLLLLLFIRLPGYSEGGKMLVTMRKIGHEVLLNSGDFTSWVLPIEAVDDRTFRIRFQRPFAFTPTSLVEIIQRHVPELDYLVEVRKEHSNTVVYSYEVHQPFHRKSVACLSRTPPSGTYLIQIKFAEPPVQAASITNTLPFAWFLLPILLVGFGWCLFRRKRPAPAKPAIPTTLVHLGPLTFCRQTQMLHLGDERVELSAKESKLLNVFVGAPNTVIDRSQLMEQVWEDEGVFVGRSLDVFVSRLRKKLQPAPTVRIVNSHGRGYKLEIDSSHG